MRPAARPEVQRARLQRPGGGREAARPEGQRTVPAIQPHRVLRAEGSQDIRDREPGRQQPAQQHAQLKLNLTGEESLQCP